MSPTRLFGLCALLVLAGIAYVVLGPTSAERLTALLDAQRWAEAEALARDALEDASDEARPDYFRALGIALDRQERHLEAIDAYRAAYALRSEDDDLRHRAAIEIVHVGRRHDAQDDPDAALERYREAVELAPEIPHGHRSLVEALRRRGAIDEAIAALNAGLEHGPRDFRLRIQLAWLLATHPDPSRRDADRALDLASDLFLHDRTPETLEAMAAARAARGDFAEAVLHQVDAIELAGGEGAPGFDARRARLETYKTRRPHVEGGS